MAETVAMSGSTRKKQWHEQSNKPHYLFMLRLANNLKRAVACLKEDDCQGCHNFAILGLVPNRAFFFCSFQWCKKKRYGWYFVGSIALKHDFWDSKLVFLHYCRCSIREASWNSCLQRFQWV